MPDHDPAPGERSIQQTFTEEWDLLDANEDELSFGYTLDDLVKLNREVWLKWLPSYTGALHRVLEVGCGAGRETQALRRVLPDAEIFAVDLNFSILKGGSKLMQDPNIHVVLCSVFRLPFREDRFDLAYSQGVLHHTYSTHGAVGSVAPLVRQRGRFFIWLYGRDDAVTPKGWRGLRSRSALAIERLLRPALSRMPPFARNGLITSIGTVLHPYYASRMHRRTLWRIKDTLHLVRDWLTPRYAHLHSYNEVMEWFEDLGYDVVDVQSTRAYRRLFGRALWGVGLTGERTARPAVSISRCGELREKHKRGTDSRG